VSLHSAQRVCNRRRGIRPSITRAQPAVHKTFFWGWFTGRDPAILTSLS
jgi:hypothetical protein